MVMTLERVDAPTPDAQLYEVNRRSSAYIRWIQTSLNRIMGSGLVVNGVLNLRTQTAIRAFQRRRGLLPDGLVGWRTDAALIASGASRPPATSPGTAPVVGPLTSVNTSLPTPGPGYYSYKPTTQQFGLPETIRAVQAIGTNWQRTHPQGPRLGIGDISNRGGGPMRGHASHQRGVDFDLRAIRGDGQEAGVTYQSPVYSRPLTQELVNLIRTNGILRVQYIFFNDPSVLDVRRWPHHDDHLHVRFFAPGGQPARHAEVGPLAGRAGRASHVYVRWVQQSLNRIARSELPIDGIMGPATRNALRLFQASRKIFPDGALTRQTEAGLVAAGASPPPGAIKPTAPTPAPSVQTPVAVCKPTGLTAPETTAVALTSRLETGTPFRFVVSPVDGISVGMLQWNLLAGTLQRLLVGFERAGGRLEEFFGADGDRLRRLVSLPDRLQAVREAKDEQLARRWRTRFLRLSGDSRFCRLMTQDVHARLRSSEVAAHQLGLNTVRGLSMIFDIATGDGLGARKVRVLAGRVSARRTVLGRQLTEREQLVEIANAAADLVRKPSLKEERRARRLLIANGSGRYRGSQWDLNKEFTTLDERWR